MRELRHQEGPVRRRVADLIARHAELEAAPLLRVMAEQEFPGRLAVVSSFGTESAVLLSLVAAVAPRLPVIFLETGMHFEETRRYRDELVATLGLEDVRLVLPEAEQLARLDPAGQLCRVDPDACCHLRKVAPLRRVLVGFDAWVTGRKRYHGGLRGSLPTIEAADGKIKINPLASWSQARIEAAFESLALPRHPLAARGYRSIGCRPCTRPEGPGEPLRAGRWSHCGKTECGIHLSAPVT